MTQFADEGFVSVQDENHSSSLHSSCNPYPTQTLIDMLERPYPIATVKWKSTSNIDDELLDLDFPYALFKQQAIIQHIQNFKYLRADVRLGFRVNGTKFHYGKVLVAASPASYLTGDLYDSTSNIFSGSGFPNVVLSACDNEVQELVIPYAMPTHFIDLHQLDKVYNILGSFQMRVLNPLNLGPTTTDVNITVFANFEKITLAGFTSEPIIPSVPKTLRKPFSSQISKLRLLAQGANGLNSVSERVMNWGRRILQKVTPISITNFQFANVDTEDRTHTLSVKQDNSVLSSCALMASPECERDFSHIFGTPTLLDVARIAIDLGEFHVEYPVAPWASYKDLIVNDDLSTDYRIYPTMLAHASAPFKYWRGSLIYHIDITCSAFHSGRVRVAWEPHVGNDAVADMAMANLVNRVVDIQKESSFSFTIPYLQPTEWLENAMVGGVNLHGFDEVANGRIVIDSIHDFTHPETPPPPIYLNVYVSGGPDFEVARPTTEFMNPPELVAQGSNRESMRLIDAPPLCLGYNPNLAFNSATMGEKIVRVNEIISRPGLIMNKDEIAEDVTMRHPSFLDLRKTSDLSQGRVTYEHWYRYIYRFMRGCAKVTLWPDVPIIVTNANYPALERKEFHNRKDPVWSQDGGCVFDPNITRNMDITLPMYTKHLLYVNSTSCMQNMPGFILTSFPGHQKVNFSLFTSPTIDTNLGFLVGPPPIKRRGTSIPIGPTEVMIPTGQIWWHNQISLTINKGANQAAGTLEFVANKNNLSGKLTWRYAGTPFKKGNGFQYVILSRGGVIERFTDPLLEYTFSEKSIYHTSTSYYLNTGTAIWTKDSTETQTVPFFALEFAKEANVSDLAFALYITALDSPINSFQYLAHNKDGSEVIGSPNTTVRWMNPQIAYNQTCTLFTRDALLYNNRYIHSSMFLPYSYTTVGTGTTIPVEVSFDWVTDRNATKDFQLDHDDDGTFELAHCQSFSKDRQDGTMILGSTPKEVFANGEPKEMVYLHVALSWATKPT